MRALLLKLFCAGVVALLALFAWVSHHPDHRLVDAAREWPLVGPWAEAFQLFYRSPQAVPPPPAPPREVELIAPEVIDATLPVWVTPGTPLKAAPEERARTLAVFEVYANLATLEARPPWFYVRLGEARGWVRFERPESERPPLGRAAEPVVAMAPRPPDADTLAAARALLDGERADRLGPYQLFTDHRNPVLRKRLATLAAGFDQLYAERFGRVPLGTPQAAVVIYRQVDTYRRFQARSQRLAGLTPTGHSIAGIAALYAGDQDLDAVTGTFVHELTHLVNRRALGPALPPWLDEGTAEALGTARISPAGVVDPRAWGGHRWQVGERITFDGGQATLHSLRQAIAADALPPLAELVRLDWPGFVRTGRRSLHYDLAGAFIRFLLDGGHGRRADGLRDFLADVAAGIPPDGDRLLAALGSDWPSLDRALRAWIAEQAAP